MYKLDVTKQLIFAQELCGHKTPEVAQLGVGVLFAAKSDDAKRAGVPEFLKALPKNHSVSHSALVRADCLFEDRGRKQWIGSDQQKMLLARFTEVMTEPDAVEVADHIVKTRYRVSSDGSSHTPQEATALLVRIANDPKQSKAVRQIVIERVVEVANNAGVRSDFTFEILAAVVRSGTDDASRLIAANGIARFKWGTPVQLDVLRGLLKDEPDAEIKKLLQSAIDAPGKK